MLSAAGFPPDTLIFPAGLFPTADTGRLIVQLSYDRFATPSFQDLSTQPSYRAIYILEVVLRWVVQIDGPAGPAEEPALVPEGSPPESQPG